MGCLLIYMALSVMGAILFVILLRGGNEWRS